MARKGRIGAGEEEGKVRGVKVGKRVKQTGMERKGRGGKGIKYLK